MAMSKKVVVIVAAAVIVLLSALFFMMQSRSSDQTTQEFSPVEDSAQGADSSNKGSIASLLASGNTTTCTISYPDNQGNGTVYVSGTRLRGDFTISGSENHMIHDGDFVYFWSGNKGTKMKIDKTIPTPTPTGQVSSQADINREADLNCSSWTVDGSKFAVPADVQFTDMTQMMQQMQEQSSGMKQSNEAMCDAITDPQAKASCVSAIKGQ